MNRAAKTFVHSVKVRFGQVDAAGVVFHPRYFEMLNDAIEDWFAKLGFPFADLHLGKAYGVPLVHIEADFFRPSRLGDDLDFTLHVVRIGRASLELGISCGCKREKRLAANVVIAQVDLKKGKAAEWGPDMKKAIRTWL